MQDKPAETTVELFGGPHDGYHLPITCTVEPDGFVVPSVSGMVYCIPGSGEGWHRAHVNNYYKRFEQGKYRFESARLDIPVGAKTTAKPLKADWNF